MKNRKRKILSVILQIKTIDAEGKIETDISEVLD